MISTIPRKPPKDLIINGKYILGEKFGSGSFGEVYFVLDIKTKTPYAAKIEDIRAKSLQLCGEASLLKMLQKADGFPELIWYGTQDGYNIMICELLGQSLEDIFVALNRKFSLKTVVNIAIQILTRLEHLHSLNHIHRDIKPDNFLIGKNSKATKIYMIDFGLSKSFRDPKTYQHVMYQENKTLTGTARYASINAHLGIVQSRRDDLESLGYMLIYFLKGRLPWQNIKTKNRQEKFQKIKEQKLAISSELLCKNLPDEFKTYLEYCKKLPFSNKPDYQYLKKLFENILPRNNLKKERSSEFDWLIDNKYFKDVNGDNQLTQALTKSCSALIDRTKSTNQVDNNNNKSKTKNDLHSDLDSHSSIYENTQILSIPIIKTTKKTFYIMKSQTLN